MTNPGLKIVAVIVISIGLLIPLGLICGVITERTSYRAEAREDIARSWTGAQHLKGPLLAVPSRSASRNLDADKEWLYVLPETLEIQASLNTQMRKRGLYSVPVYSARLVILGEFDLSGVAPSGGPGWADLDLDGALLALSFSDNRGIAQQPKLEWNGDSREIETGSALPMPAEGVYAVVGPLDPENRTRYPFRMEVELRGMETLRFAPIGGDTRVMLDAEWPHPSFIGRFLPVEYEIDEDGFRAEWKVSGLASGRNPAWFGVRRGAGALLENGFGVSMINPVDIYQQAMRSVKYGSVIILLTFTAFFLIEIVRRMMLHPMQYLLVGLALVIFFLLVLALSEHTAFGVAYLIAVVASVGLVSVYMASALGSVTNGAVFAAILGALYGMLYAILISEDNALLMGSLLLFFALAAVMLVTRRVDWYRLGQQRRPPAGAAPSPDGKS